MIGLNKNTGTSVQTLEQHVLQSLSDIITTPIGSRLMRRNYGSLIPDLIDQPLNPRTLLRLYAATAGAIMAWEPRFQIASIELSATGTGSATVEITGRIGTEFVAASVDLGQPADNRLVLGANQRIVRLLNGVNHTTTLAYSAGDEIILDVFPLAGNTGLPGGCPALVDGLLERVTFTATDTGVIGNNGASFFAGVLFRCEINGVELPLTDQYRLLRASAGHKAGEWAGLPPTRVLTQDTDTGDWLDAASNTPYPVSELMAAIYAYGAPGLQYAAAVLHPVIHSTW